MNKQQYAVALKMEDMDNQIRQRDWIIAFMLLFIAVLIFLVYSFAQDKPIDNQACVPKMQGFYQSLKENYIVAVVDTTSRTGQQLADEIQNAINQINQLQIKGGTQP